MLFSWYFSSFCYCQTRVYTTVSGPLMFWSYENKSCMRVDESWQARVCMRVFSTLMSWSDENKSYMRVDENWQARVFTEFPQLSCPDQTRTKIVQELTRVDKQEFVWEFSQLSHLSQKLIRDDKWKFLWEFCQILSFVKACLKCGRLCIRNTKIHHT